MAVGIAADPLITQLRRQITETDRAIIELVNERLELVATMKDYKARRGLDFVDAEREHRMLTHLQRANAGPLTAAGLDGAVRRASRADEARGCPAGEEGVVRFAVVGNGLMGTSVVLAAERAGFEHVSAVPDADLVVVAVPVAPSRKSCPTFSPPRPRAAS